MRKFTVRISLIKKTEWQDEDKEADEKLSEVTTSDINIEAVQEVT